MCGLITRSQTQPNGCKLHEGKAIGGEAVIACGDPTTSLDPIEEPFDPVTGAVRIRAEADWIAAIAFDGMLAHVLFNPIGVITRVCGQH